MKLLVSTEGTVSEVREGEDFRRNFREVMYGQAGNGKERKTN